MQAVTPEALLLIHVKEKVYRGSIVPLFITKGTIDGFSRHFFSFFFKLNIFALLLL